MKRSSLLSIYFKKLTRAKTVEQGSTEINEWRETL